MGKKTTDPMPDVVMRVTPRLRSNDCAVWSLATLSGRDYADVLDAITKEDPKHKGSNGLYFSQVIRAAKRLGLRLYRKRRYSLTDDTGILGVTLASGISHACILKQGQVIDVDGTVWEVESYLLHYRAVSFCLLALASRHPSDL